MGGEHLGYQTDLLVAGDLTQPEEADQEPDYQSEESKQGSLASTDDGESSARSREYPRQACSEDRQCQPQIIEESVAPTLTGGYETVEHCQERRERSQEPDGPPAEPGHGQYMESRPVRVLGSAFHATTMLLTLLALKGLTSGLAISA